MTGNTSDIAGPVSIPGKGDRLSDGFLMALPLVVPVVLAGLFVVAVLFGRGMTGSWAIVASAVVLLVPFAGLLLARWRWRGGGGLAALVPLVLAVAAIALGAAPMTAMLGTATTGARPTSPGGTDTRLWRYLGVTDGEVREPLIVATVLVSGLVVGGWVARRHGTGTLLVAIWAVAVVTCLVWLPLLGFVQLGLGLSSHSPASPAVDLIWALPFVAHAAAPVLAVMAGGAVSARPLENADTIERPSSVLSREQPFLRR